MPLAWRDMAFAAPTMEDSLYDLTETDDGYTVTARETIPVLLLDVPFLLSDNSMFMKMGETLHIRKCSSLHTNSGTEVTNG